MHSYLLCKDAFVRRRKFYEFVKKVQWNLTALAMVPFVGVETKRDRRLKGRFQRSQQKQLNKQ
jgi:hypothetical protein